MEPDAGNIELIKLLVKRKANAASTNKSKKTAMDLSKTAEVKAALQEAIDAALQQAEASKAEASGGIATVDSTDQQETAAANEQQRPDLAPEAEPADMIGPQIGPPERPPTHSAATTSNAPAAELHSDVTANQLVSGQPDAGVTASDRQPDTDRPVKKQKVALSFADDDEQ